ncbi:MAG: hypothetical protein LBR32_07030, partial [Propionibacteriaceae bacterium]|nr:hypothetical protein [Propionibacteriaceae bacterium]
DNLTRADSAAFLQRAFGHFSDVHVWTAHSADIAWMYLRGITTGWDMGGGRYEYRPANGIVRSDLNTFMTRIRVGSYTSGTGGLNRAQFARILAQASGAAQSSDTAAVAWMINKRLTDATSYAQYSPGSALVRCDTAAFLHRAYDKALFR